ncbi:hypothetical protein KY348_02755 [Candidatus Woesearchaeota archaeon]|nr:hypothetical protein [Candidatus Woesearchaeota archaeon]
MTFEKDKENALNKKDLSAKGCLDKRIKPLVDLINSMDDYFTSSSCSGRILLLKVSEEEKKKRSKWLFLSHEKIDAPDILSALKDLPEEEVWFKMEPMILHICCKTIDNAAEILERISKLGLTHSGIFSLKKKIVVEIFGNERIECIVAKDRELLVNEDYIRALVEAANNKLELTHKKIDELHKLFK